MARNAPDVSAVGATYTLLSFSFIDDSGKKKAKSIKADPAVTDAQIQALAVALGNGTNAVLYKVEKSLVWRAAPDSSLAVDAEQNSVADEVIITFQKNDGTTQRIGIPAPIEGMMDGDSNNVNIAAATYTAVRDAAEAVMENAYEPVSTRYNQHRQINQRRPAQ